MRDDGSTDSLRTSLLVACVLVGGVVSVGAGLEAADGAAFRSEPQLTYEVHALDGNDTRYVALPADARRIAAAGINGSDGTVRVDREAVPEPFADVVTETGPAAPTDATSLLHGETVYRVTATRDDGATEEVTLVFTPVEGAHRAYASLSPRTQEVFDEALAADGEVASYRPSVAELDPGARTAGNEVGENAVYVSYRGEQYLLEVDRAYDPWTDLFELTTATMLAGSALVALGAMPLLAPATGRRAAAAVGGAVVAGPQLLVHGPLVLVPAPRPLRMLWVGAAAAVLVAGGFLLATRDVSRGD